MKKLLLSALAALAVTGASAATGQYYSDYFDTTEEREYTVEDGVYTVKAFYGVDGYDLKFSINEDGSIEILNAYYEYGDFKYVETGLQDITYVCIYPVDGYSEFDEGIWGKNVWFYAYNSDAEYEGGYDEFLWDIPDVEPIDLSGFVGEYTGTMYYTTQVDDVAEKVEEEREVELLIDEDITNTLIFANLFMAGWDPEGMVYPDNTIRFVKESFDDTYWLLGHTGDSFDPFTPESMVYEAEYDPETYKITFRNWTIAYDYTEYGVGYMPVYVDTSYVLSPKNSGIGGVSADADAPVEYYSLQGVRIAKPQPGQIVICRQGTKSVKTVVR